MSFLATKVGHYQFMLDPVCRPHDYKLKKMVTGDECRHVSSQTCANETLGSQSALSSSDSCHSGNSPPRITFFQRAPQRPVVEKDMDNGGGLEDRWALGLAQINLQQFGQQVITICLLYLLRNLLDRNHSVSLTPFLRNFCWLANENNMELGYHSSQACFAPPHTEAWKEMLPLIRILFPDV